MENLLLAFPGFLGNPAIKEEPRVPCGKFSLGFSRLFQASLGFPGNAEIKEKAGCVRNHSSQKLRAFLHIRKSLESEEIFFLGSPGFSRNSWKARGPGHSWLFRAFSWLFLMCKKARKARNFTPEFRGIPGTFLQGSAAVFITRNLSPFVRAMLPDCGVLKVLRSIPEGVRLQNNSPAKNV